jgi:hypothetical protein
VFRRRFLLLSTDRSQAIASGMRVQWWDFLFYLSFAVIITSSVRIAGVLLVFILLIAPAVCGAMLASEVRARLLIGWAAGALATGGGLALSARMDWPPAPAISCIFAVILLAVALGSHIAAAPRRTRAALRSLATLAVLGGLGLGLVHGLRARRAALDGEDELHSHGLPEHGLGHSRTDLITALGDEHEQVRATAATQLGALHDTALLQPLLRALEDPAASVKEQAAEALAKLARPEAVPALQAALAREDADEWVHLRVAEALAHCGGVDGVDALVAMAQEADAKLVRAQAQKTALAVLEGAPALRGAADQQAAQLATFWGAQREHARWDPQAKHCAFAR